MRAGVIAHDFNNLLTSILGHVELFERSAQLSPADSGRIDQIRHAVQSAGRLAQQLVDPVDSPTVRAEATPLAFPDAIEQTLSILSPLLGDQIEPSLALLTVHTPLGLKRSQLDRLLMNLVVNAISAMPHGGTLNVRLEDVTLDAEQADQLDLVDGPYLSLEVSDTGTGMTPSVLDHALEPFLTTKPHAQRASCPATRSERTGHGLTIVAAIMNELSGAVKIQSTAGSGTTVTLYLPRRTGRSTSPRPPSLAETLDELEIEQVAQPARRAAFAARRRP